MDEGETKPFDLVTIILLMMVAFLDDATTVAALFAVAIPVLGEITFVLDKVFAGVAWVIIQGTFAFKLRSFGAPGIVNTIGGALEEASIPATAITTFAAIQIANHPKIAKVVEVVGTSAALGGVGGLMEAEGVATESGIEAAATAENAGATIETQTEPDTQATASRRPSEVDAGVKPSEIKAPHNRDEEEDGQKHDISEKAFGMPSGPFEEAQEETGLTGELPQPEEKEEEDKIEEKRPIPFGSLTQKKGEDKGADKDLPKAA